ncbi:MAG: hypothetical protein WD005_06420, partial [Haliea sp.]
DALYKSRMGHALPAAAALEREIVTLGVAQKQRAKARQVFERSARQAGFIQQDTERFVTPPKAARQSGASDGAKGAGRESGGANDGGQGTGGNSSGGSGGGGEFDSLDPFIQGLLKRLPKPDSTWSMQDRANWLIAAEQVFKLIYKTDGQDQYGIKIDVAGSMTTRAGTEGSGSQPI